MKAGRRYSYHLTGSEISHELWNCPFTRALCHIAFCHRDELSSGREPVREAQEELILQAPIVGILLASLQIHSQRVSSGLLHLDTSVISHALDVLVAKLKVGQTWHGGYPFHKLEFLFRSSGALPLVDSLANGHYPSPLDPYRDNDVEGIYLPHHPLFSVLSTGFFTTDMISGLRTDQSFIVLIFVRWYVKRYYHSLERPPQVKLSTAVRWILQVYLVNILQCDRTFFQRETNGILNLYRLKEILEQHCTAFVSCIYSTDCDQIMLHSQSGGLLQSTVEIVNFISVTNRIQPWSIEHCYTCGKEVTTDIYTPRKPSFCCLEGNIMDSLRALHKHTPFVRLTPEETQLLREQLSNPQGGLPAYHKTTPHSEKVRHFLLKSFLRFAPDVPGMCFFLASGCTAKISN